MMEKTFDPASVEGRIGQLWEEQGAFRAGRAERAGAEPYTIVIPPPNVTGSLHMGHALNNTLQDILCRFERMRGRDVLWQPGTDHAGIATQMVVERKLAAEKRPDRRSMGRKAFLEEVWRWKEESGGTINAQLKRLGASCDWSRLRFTMGEGGAADDQMVRAVTKVFVALYKDGLIYRDKRLVNWDPHFESAISDLEVLQIEKRGTFKMSRQDEEPFNAAALFKLLDKEPSGHLYTIDYPLAGKVYDANDSTTFIRIATTRPETLLGDTAIAVHPENDKLKHLIGRQAVLPLVGRLIPIVGDDYADPEKGTGAVKITPAHDFNDFEVGKRHALPAINILDSKARIDIEGNSDFTFGEGVDRAPVLALHGQDRFAARKAIITLLHETGVLSAIEPSTMMVPHGDRSNVVIEPWLTDQWYVDAKTLAQPALAAVRSGKTKFVPENWEKTYFQWLEHIEPWCVSRQLWWGHQIPAWYGPDQHVFVALSEAQALEEAKAHYGHAVELRRDEDVLDTWFSSALWPFSTLGWPDETAEVKRYYPTNVLVTGFDIIFFWVARMMMMGLHFMPDIPFSTVYIHALVRDEKGAKMSKSKGNVIDPIELVDQFGADALRFTLSAMAAQGRDIKLSTQRVEGYRNFATKLWNATRFAGMNGCKRAEGFDPHQVKLALNRWAMGELAQAIQEVTQAIEAYRFNDAANAAYRFVWNIVCDWYLELSKPVFSGADTAAKAETQASIAYVIDETCRLLHPFMPFITEEIWGLTGQEGPKRDSVLALAAWPDGKGLGDQEAEQEIGWLVDLVTDIRSARAETNVPGGAQVPLVLVNPSAQTQARVERWSDMIKRLARISEFSTATQAPKQAIGLIVRGEVVALPLEGIIDLEAERARLGKEIDKISSEAEKIKAKLANADFVARAPEEVVEEQRERLEDGAERLVKLREALARLA
jgi:valyl-tRNA synthetase